MFACPHRLEEADHLKCACAGCGHVIEYLPAAAGQVIECPKCGEKSLLPPADAKPSRAPAASPAGPLDPDEPLRRPCPDCGASLGPRDITCPACAAKQQRKRLVRIRALTAAAALVAVIAVTAVVWRLFYPRSGPGVEGGSITNVTLLAPPKVHTPKSTNDFEIGRFTIDKRRGLDTSLVTGDIQNTSRNLYRHVRVDLEVLDAHGAKIGTLTDIITEFPADQTWHIILNTPDPKAASVRVTGIREEK